MKRVMSIPVAIFLALNIVLFAGRAEANDGKCTYDTLKLGVCVSLLNDLVSAKVNTQGPCCTLLAGLVDLDAAACLCLALKNVLGIVNIPVNVKLLLNACGRDCPDDYSCPIL